jgi:hypothetical protein
MVERVNRPASQGIAQRLTCSANGASSSCPETTARHEFDLCVDVTKLALHIANCCVVGYLGLSQPHHLLRPLVLYFGAIECECVAVAAIGAGSILARAWQRLRQFSASLR